MLRYPDEFKETPACADKNTAFPTEDVCPKCGADIEIWSDEDETTCRSCDYAEQVGQLQCG